MRKEKAAQTETPVETLEQIAERILVDGIDCTGRVFESRMKLAILSALRNERERCARVAETHSATDCDGPDCGIVIAQAIRKGDDET